MKFHTQNTTVENIASFTNLRELLRDPAYWVLIDTLPDGFIVIDRQGLVVCMNSSAESITDIDRKDVIGQTLDLLVSKSVLDFEQVVFSFKQTVPVKIAEGHLDGSKVLITTKITRDQNHDFIFQVVILRNLELLLNQSDGILNSQKHFKSLTDRQNGPDKSLNSLVLKQNGQRMIEKGIRAIGMKSRVLLTGESGVGKTETAHYLHIKSLGSDKPFIHVNCSSIPETLFESELFGYEKGAFTGAHNRGKKGLIEAANGGTLFLDEIGEVPLLSQPKLLQFLEDGKIQRLGATATKHVNVNVVAATNRDLVKMVEEKTFRADLYYRVSVINLEIPPLRETREIIPGLIQLFLSKVNKRRGSIFTLSKKCEEFLLGYCYPGNIRELQNILEHLAVECDEVAETDHLPAKVKRNYIDKPQNKKSGVTLQSQIPQTAFSGLTLKDAVREFEKNVISQAIDNLGSKRKAAKALGVDIATIVRKTKA